MDSATVRFSGTRRTETLNTCEIQEGLLFGILSPEDEIFVEEQQRFVCLGNHADFITWLPLRRSTQSEVPSSRGFLVVCVDMTLMLLGFFVLTCGGDVVNVLGVPPSTEWARPGEGRGQQDTKDMIATVSSTGFTFEGDTVPSDISVQELASRIARAAGNRKRRLLIHAAPDASAQAVFRIFDAVRVKECGIADVALLDQGMKP